MSPSVPDAPTDTSARGSGRRRTVIASMVGTTIEWYDFNIYGSVAALVFGKLFFPDMAPAVGTLLALATFGVGFFARPSAASSSVTSVTEWDARRRLSRPSC